MIILKGSNDVKLFRLERFEKFELLEVRVIGSLTV